MSVPLPPITVTSPASSAFVSKNTKSLPPPASMESVPAPASIVSSPPPDLIVSAAAPPVILISAFVSKLPSKVRVFTPVKLLPSTISRSPVASIFASASVKALLATFFN